MNNNQRENTAKMFYDLVKVPLSFCCFGVIAAGQHEIAAYTLFGVSFSVLFYYIALLMDRKNER